MARRARIKVSSEDSLYHVCNRVNGPLDWRPLLDPKARLLFVEILVFLLRIYCVEFNPVAAFLVKRPEDWAWSSARTRGGKAEPQPWPLTRVTGMKDPEAARRWFEESRARYAAQRRAREAEEDWMWLRGRVVGSEEFVARFINAEKQPDRRPVPWVDGQWSSLDRLRPRRDAALAA